MKKREVYEGWRYPCERKSFEWNKGFLMMRMITTNRKQIYLARIAKKKKFFDGLPGCPCGKGCKPIKCKIIVENEV